MDHEAVRREAEAHAKATVAGDLKTAGSSLDKSAYGAAGDVMKAMPGTLESCEIESVEDRDGQVVARIRYSGEGSSTTVESVWGDIDGQPKIVDLKVV